MNYNRNKISFTFREHGKDIRSIRKPMPFI